MVLLNITGTILGSDVNETNKLVNSLASWSLQSGRWRHKQINTVKSYWCNHEKYIQGRGGGVK